MSLRTLWVFLAVMLPVLASLLASLPTTDLAYHLRAGAEIFDTGRLPAADTWTFTASGMPWVDQQWGAQALLAAVYRATGWVGLIVLRAVLVGAIFGILLVLCRRHGVGVRTSALLVLGAFAIAAPALALRPQLIGMLLFALTLLLVAERRRRPTLIWLVPVLAVAWANIHGSFFLAPVVLGFAWLADVTERDPAHRRTFLAAAVTAIGCCVTPFGPAVWQYAVGIGTDPDVTRRITEWQPTSIRGIEGVLFFGSALLVAGMLARRSAPTPWTTLLWLAFFFVIGAFAARGVAWWPLALVAAAAPLIAADPERRPAVREPRPIRWANAAIAAALLVAGVALLPHTKPIHPGTGAPREALAYAPVGVTEALEGVVEPGDRLLNPQPWGSWFELTVPQALVAIDSRIELFPSDVWDDFERIRAGVDGWENVLEEWDVRYAVVTAEEEAMQRRLEAEGWVEVYSDDDGAILERPGPGPSGSGTVEVALLESSRD